MTDQTLPSNARANAANDANAARLAALGALLGLTGVVLGAFGAHALRARIGPEMLEVYRTGVLYQLFHAIALLGVAGIVDHLRRPMLTGILFTTGVVIFSGSLYVLAITGTRAWGAVTPLGGLALISGWAWTLFTVMTKGRQRGV